MTVLVGLRLHVIVNCNHCQQQRLQLQLLRNCNMLMPIWCHHVAEKISPATAHFADEANKVPLRQQVQQNGNIMFHL